MDVAALRAVQKTVERLLRVDCEYAKQQKGAPNKWLNNANNQESIIMLLLSRQILHHLNFCY
jgi:hypothetical protein